ncbi:hypothetical protein [Thomasclavelia sp.]|uniref:hypothetical protein n=1 Tax=Thomasclavelia sp. TaxID=3025757 RepID=UPI0025E804E3|nr:hypothetical protein [Thomasclavelia sp.]
MVKSIFELERRFDFDKEFNRLYDLLNMKIYNYEFSRSRDVDFWTIVDKFFTKWEHRLTAINANQYFSDLEIHFKTPRSCNKTQKLYILQFIDSYICYLINTHTISNNYSIISNSYSINTEDEIFAPYLVIIKNIGVIIENLNFERQLNHADNSVTYIKRDADVDSVLSILENEDDLRMTLLEYNDFRIENDVNEKRIILKKLGDYLEPKRREFNSINKSLTDDVFFMLNKFYIRHNNDGNVKFNTDDDYIKWYNKLFKMIIHLIRTKYIINIHNDLKEYKI